LKIGLEVLKASMKLENFFLGGDKGKLDFRSFLSRQRMDFRRFFVALRRYVADLEAAQACILR